MNAVIYARYSSDNQREESIEGQLRECKAFAKAKGLQIVGTYIDRALSAKTDNRPQFQKMIRDSAQKKFELVIVWKLDRFSRNRYDSARYKAALKKNGVRVVSATEAISEGAEGILLESLLEGMAEYYSAELGEKVLRGMTDNALKCKYNGGGLLTGYTIDAEQNYQIDPITAPIVRSVFQKYADGCTIMDIVRDLGEKGLRTSKGKPFEYNAVEHMLHNRRYLGEYRFRDVVIPGGIPQIVPQELFDLVQDRLKTNREASGRHKAKEEFILTTKLYCGKCGSYMVGESGTSKTGATYRYYKCGKAKRKHTCSKKPVKKEWIENLVMERVKQIILDDALLDRIAEELIALQGKEDEVLAALRRQHAEAEKAINNLLDAMQQGIVTSSTKDRLQKLEAEKEAAEIEIAKREIAQPRFSKEQILFFIHELQKLDLNKPAHQRKLIDCFVNAIYLYDDKLIITFNFKRNSETIPVSEIVKKEKSSDLTGAVPPKKKTAERLSFSLANFRIRRGRPVRTGAFWRRCRPCGNQPQACGTQEMRTVTEAAQPPEYPPKVHRKQKTRQASVFCFIIEENGGEDPNRNNAVRCSCRQSGDWRLLWFLPPTKTQAIPLNLFNTQGKP